MSEMTEHKTMNTVIHAAFRRDLARFGDALGSFPAGSRTRADQLEGAWDNFSYQLRHHHEDEETIFWPELRELGTAESLMGELESEHAQMLSALDASDAAIKAFHGDPSAENASTAQSTITDLGVVILSHLDHEETRSGTDRGGIPWFAPNEGRTEGSAQGPQGQYGNLLHLAARRCRS